MLFLDRDRWFRQQAALAYSTGVFEELVLLVFGDPALNENVVAIPLLNSTS